jgi:maltose-binding protein MalE
MFRTRRLRLAAGLALAALLGVVAASSGTSATGQGNRIVIWADADRVPAVTEVANAWARSKGVTVQVVQKQMGPIRQEIATVAADTAPDVIVGAHDWVGELSANGSVLPLSPSAATKKQFPAYALNSFSYGTAIKKLYGAPVALENIALVTNTRLAKVPKSWADLEKQALAAKRKTKAQVGIAVQQGQGDAYHMYPFFSGLGGYIFGTNKAGNLDPSDIGVANARFLRNASLIDKWNKEGLIRSQVNDSIAKDLFLRARSPTTSPARGSSLTSARPASSTRSRPSRRWCRASGPCRSSASRASWSRSTRPPTASRAWRRTWSRAT